MWPIQFVFLMCNVCMTLLYFLTPCNTSSFLTRWVQQIFSILHQHHILKLPACFWSKFRHVQVSAPHKAMLQTQNFTSFFLKFKSKLLVKRVFFLLNAAFVMAILDLILRVRLYHLLRCYPNILNIPHSPVVFDLSQSVLGMVASNYSMTFYHRTYCNSLSRDYTFIRSYRCAVL